MVKQNENRVTRSYLSIIRDEKKSSNPASAQADELGS